MATLEEETRAALDGPQDADAIEFQGRWYTWAELRQVADEVSRLLAASCLTPGVPVAFAPRNTPAAIAAELGMIASRHTIHMVYAFQSAAGIARDVGRLNVGAVIAAAADFSPELLEVVQARGIAAIALGDMSAGFVAGAEQSRVGFDAAPVTPQILIHTSGTTGAPKHVGFSFDTILHHIVGQQVSQVARAEAVPPSALLYYPLGNISGIYSTLPPLLNRRRVVLIDRFTFDHWLDWVRRFRPAAPLLPPAGVRMAVDADVSKEDFASIRMLITGAAPLDPTVQRAFEEKYGIPILSSYGATEFGGPVTAMTPEHLSQFGRTKTGSVGKPFAGARLRVVDSDTHAEMPAGEEGLLEVVAPRVGDHWIRTTDRGVIDADGFVFLRGRADGAIVRGGFKLLPEVIERALCMHPAVAAASVVGINDDRLGQVPAAAIQLKLGADEPPLAELEQHLRQQVYATHIPTRWLFVEAIPLNKSAKPDIAGVRLLFGQDVAVSK